MISETTGSERCNNNFNRPSLEPARPTPESRVTLIQCKPRDTIPLSTALHVDVSLLQLPRRADQLNLLAPTPTASHPSGNVMVRMIAMTTLMRRGVPAPLPHTAVIRPCPSVPMASVS